MSFSTVLTFILTYPTIPLACALVILVIYIAVLHHKIHRFTRGASGSSLEAVIKECVDAVTEIEKRNELIAGHALSLDTRVSQALRNAQLIRYKAFEQHGSNQSFSVALLNEKGDGVVISTLHAHDRVSTFAKPIEKYTSTHELTEEEKEVIKLSKEDHKKTR